MSDLGKLRERIRALALDADEAGLDDEDWYDRLWELLEPVIDARAELAHRGLAQAAQPSWLDDVQRLKFPAEREGRS